MTASSAFTPDLARQCLDALAKPQGSLGELERLALRLAETQRSLTPRTRPARLVVFAGDHGVVEEGVGLWPSEVTAVIMRLTLQGRSAAAALARGVGAELVLIDAGSQAAPIGDQPGYRDWRVARGSANLAREPAMQPAQLDAALDVGARAAREAANAGIQVLAVGEIGIGNTTIASCLTALLTGADPATTVGPGAGASEASLARKREVVTSAVTRARGLLAQDRHAAIAAVCGYEIAAMAGCLIEASRLGLTIVLDGFITGAAALIARELDPRGLDTAIAAHGSAEPGHAGVLAHLGLRPFLDWRLRLGEGTGALLLLSLLDAAAALLRDMATLEEAMRG